jgi:hypothetical protein
LQRSSVWYAESSALHVESLPSLTIAWQPACSSVGSDEQQLDKALHPLPLFEPLPLELPDPEQSEASLYSVSAALQSAATPPVTIAWQLDCSVLGRDEQQLERSLQSLPPEPMVGIVCIVGLDASLGQSSAISVVQTAASLSLTIS